MRTSMIVLLGCCLMVSVEAMAVENEHELVNQYLKRSQQEKAHKLSFISFDATLNRINRHNEYNTFATYESQRFPETNLKWLGEAKCFGLDLGVVLGERLAWSVGGEYWLTLGQKDTGPFIYNSAAGTVTVPELRSQISVFGARTGLQFYLLGHPTKAAGVKSPCLRLGGSVGWYQATWNLWPEYRNLNLSTSAPETENIAFEDSGPGFGANLGLDYPLPWTGFAIGVDCGYLYLNLDKMAWYKSSEQEIVATYDGTTQGRVDFQLSGVTGRLAIKRFFSW